MARRTFAQWVDAIFDHPVTDPAWYWERDADTCEEVDEVNAAYLAQLFVKSDDILRRFDDAQVNQGLNVIANPSCSSHAFSVVHDDAPWPVRRRAIRAISDLYARCFATRCTETLGHTDEACGPLNYICYMWWDVFPAWPDPAVPARSSQEEAQAGEYLLVMERCLTIPHDACAEGALHGLGHWHETFPDRVESIVDHFLAERRGLRPELIDYARRARRGGVQ